jgi:hypothetical protein
MLEENVAGKYQKRKTLFADTINYDAGRMDK